MSTALLLLLGTSLLREAVGASELRGVAPPPAPSAWNRKLAELRARRAGAGGVVSVNSTQRAVMLDASPALASPSSDKKLAAKKSTPVVKEAAPGATSAVVVNATRHSAILDANLALAARYEKAVPGFDATEEKQYRTCAAVIKAAWHEEANSPCSVNAHNARDAMRDQVPACIKLDGVGAEYHDSYKDLLKQTDIWCDGPACKPGCTGKERCVRYKDFPFQAMCEDTDKLWGVGRDGDYEHPDLVKPKKSLAYRGGAAALLALLAARLL